MHLPVVSQRDQTTWLQARKQLKAAQWEAGRSMVASALGHVDKVQASLRYTYLYTHVYAYEYMHVHMYDAYIYTYIVHIYIYI